MRATDPQRSATLATKQIKTEAEAISIVRADIQRHGGNPHDEECSARLTDEGWYVTAWHIMYPDNVGSSRFVPGGFTDYLVSREGGILKTLPGK